jgi:hypothetical protein
VISGWGYDTGALTGQGLYVPAKRLCYSQVFESPHMVSHQDVCEGGDLSTSMCLFCDFLVLPGNRFVTLPMQINAAAGVAAAVVCIEFQACPVYRT